MIPQVDLEVGNLKCDFCQKEDFKSGMDLALHLLEKHEDKVKSELEWRKRAEMTEISFFCQKCNFKTKDRQIFNEHFDKLQHKSAIGKAKTPTKPPATITISNNNDSGDDKHLNGEFKCENLQEKFQIFVILDLARARLASKDLHM